MTFSDKLHKLSQKQLNAIEFILSGENDSRVAEKVKVTRQTINHWKNRDSLFAATLNLRRHEIWNGNNSKLMSLAEDAIKVLENLLQSENERTSMNVAVHILKALGIYGQQLKYDYTTDPDKIMRNLAKKKVQEQQSDDMDYMFYGNQLNDELQDMNSKK
jgi:hypothetical protein